MRIKRPVKQINAIGAGISYLMSSITHRPVIIGMPLAAGIELTNLCNLHCPECPSGSGTLSRARGFMELDLFEKLISEAGQYLWNINLYFQGEPMLHPEFFSFVRKAGKSKVTVSTNGHFLSEMACRELAQSGIDKLIVSVDGMDNETYTLYRKGGNLEKVLNGIRNVNHELERAGGSMNIEIQFLVHKYNEGQIPLAKKFAEEQNAHLRLKSMQINNLDNISNWLPSQRKFRRFENRNGVFSLKNSYRNRCMRLWMNPVITWDGKVVPCCFDKDAEYIMGDLNSDSLQEIWNGEKYRQFRSSLLTSRKSISICRNCTSGVHGVSI
jgi:radical SAM protein with 4Fe4S-binding SPASM domain